MAPRGPRLAKAHRDIAWILRSWWKSVVGLGFVDRWAKSAGLRAGRGLHMSWLPERSAGVKHPWKPEKWSMISTWKSLRGQSCGPGRQDDTASWNNVRQLPRKRNVPIHFQADRLGLRHGNFYLFISLSAYLPAYESPFCIGNTTRQTLFVLIQPSSFITCRGTGGSGCSDQPSLPQASVAI